MQSPFMTSTLPTLQEVTVVKDKTKRKFTDFSRNFEDLVLLKRIPHCLRNLGRGTEQ